MDGNISAYLNVCNVTHFAVISQTTPSLLSTDISENAKKKFLKCLLQCQHREELTSCRDRDILFFAVYNISYRNELSTQLKPL